jgi:cell division protein FtsL
VKARRDPFLTLWTLAVVAATAAFVLYLGLRVRSVELGYELGRAHARVGRLREVKRVLELELASHKTPERVDLVARSLLGMSEPTPDRIFAAGPAPLDEEEKTARPEAPTDQVDESEPKPAPSAAPAMKPKEPSPAAAVVAPAPAPAPIDDGYDEEAQ